jgi:hypothetical protein
MADDEDEADGYEPGDLVCGACVPSKDHWAPLGTTRHTLDPHRVVLGPEPQRALLPAPRR